MTRICLNMIVKNEAARIERCLASVAPYISCWAITDTGSTDTTEQKILQFSADRNIDGKINHAPFTNFSQARNAALVNAGSSELEFDYLLLMDADMELVVEDRDVFDRLTARVYQMIQRSNNLTYWNTRLLRHDLYARYFGVTHEYLDTGGIRPEMLHGAWFKDHADGANRPGKIERDIALLEDDVRDKARSFFYLGNSYKESGRLAEAANAYETRSRLGGWAEEVWRARLERARVLRDNNNFPQFVEEALAAFSSRPWRAEPLYDLAKAYRERGMNEAAMIFAKRGLHISKPADDLLFIEDYPYATGFREEISISGYYARDPEDRELAHNCCEELALSRDVSGQTHEQAWRNLFHYTKLLSEYAPSYRAEKIKFEPPDSYHPSNPSVTRLGDKMYLNVRAVNYRIAPEGHYVMPEGETSIHTRNFLFRLDDDLTEHLLGEIALPADLPPPADRSVLGFEDIRLFPAGEDLWCNATTRQLNSEGWGEIVIARIGCGQILTNWSVIHPEGERRHEKNWMPVVGKPDIFIYSCDPLRIIDREGRITQLQPPPVAAAEWSGSSQVISFDLTGNGLFGPGFLALVHERIARPGIGKRQYQRRFVWFDRDLKIRSISRRFQFTDQSAGHEGGEFVCGMCMHPDGKRLVISHGLLDREAWLVTVDADEVRAMLQIPPDLAPHPSSIADAFANAERRAHDMIDSGHLPIGTDGNFNVPAIRDPRPASGGPSPITQPSPDTEFVQKPELDQALDEYWNKITPQPAFMATIRDGSASEIIVSTVGPGYSFDRTSWISANTNAALRSAVDVDSAIGLIKQRGWMIHPDRPKNWDVYLAVDHTAHTGAQDAILDAGGDHVSTYLPTLQMLGYTNLTSLNLLHTGRGEKNGIYYNHGNIENTQFPDGVFSFISCLSTLEHGVDVPKFLIEASRILRPEGHLFISTDFWASHINTRIDGWHIFTPHEIKDLIDTAAENRLLLTTPANLICSERVVKHAGLEYTFLSLLFRKAA